MACGHGLSWRLALSGEPMLCIYCNRREADAREHYLPQCLGRFRDFQPLLDAICQDCNQAIGGEVEREFCRRSPEAVIRSAHWIKGRPRGGRAKQPAHMYQPEKIGGEHLYFFGPDPGTGEDILWQPDEQPGTVKPISQIVTFDREGKLTGHIPIPVEITSGRELAALLNASEVEFPIPRARVVSAPDDHVRVRRLFSEINIDVPLKTGAVGRVQRQLFVGRVGPAYFRALAKIGFHYALRHIPTISGREEDFVALREFIRNGVGNPGAFLTTQAPVSYGSSGPRGHMLAAIANPDGQIVVNMQFFIGVDASLPRWQLVLGSNPTILLVKQASAHLFTYSKEDDGRLTGGEIVELSVAAGDSELPNMRFWRVEVG